MKTGNKILLLVLLCIPFIFLGIKILPVMTIDFTQFNKTNWEKYPDERYKMVADFEQKYPIEELSRETVLELLGDKHMSATKNMYSYTIGSSFIYTEHYSITFDNQGNCVSRNIYSD